eukprot:7038888-Prymnesium_polylepis.1
MFGPGRAYGAVSHGVVRCVHAQVRAPGGCKIVSSSASEQAVSWSTVDSAKATAAETAVAWWPYHVNNMVGRPRPGCAEMWYMVVSSTSGSLAT